MNNTEEELSSLLKSISADKPCGYIDSEYEFEFQRIENEIKSAESSVHWREIEKDIKKLLKKAYDFRLFFLLTKCFLHTSSQPIYGLVKGLFLIQHFTENHWDCVYPKLDTEDPDYIFDERFNAIANFGSYKELVYPISRKLYVLKNDLGMYTLQDIVSLQRGDAVYGKQPLFGLTDDEQAQYDELIGAISSALELAKSIKTKLYEKTEISYVEFDKYLIPMLEDGARLAGDSSDHSTEGQSTAGTENTSGGDFLGGDNNLAQAVSLSGAINSRSEIIKALDMICEYYDKNEPSSPIPFLLQRAKKMVDMDYREIFAEFNLGRDSDLDGLFGRPDDDK